MLDYPYRYTVNCSSFAYYWQHGVGVELLKQLASPPDLANADQLIPYLFQWDKLGDQVVIDLHLQAGLQQGNQWLSGFLNGDDLPHQARHTFDRFFENIDLYPPWLNKNRLAQGQALCQRAGLTALVVLRDYCLMGGYESAAINKPLIYTGVLKRGAVKRLMDTVEFWVQIMKPENLSKGKEGLRQIFLTRMIHSFSRVQILSKTDWDTSKWGIPINHWDLLATQLGFSLVFLVGLRRMGIFPSAQEIDGLFHLWKYIGYLLGIPLDLLPENEVQAIEALYYWTMTQREGDDDSRSLAQALQQEPLEAFYPKTVLMRKMMREIHLFYNHFLLGEYSCRLLGLPSSTIGRFAIANVWMNRKAERNMQDPTFRMRSIRKGAEEQEHVRQIYQSFSHSETGKRPDVY
ncbi:oxygenase MpaB family protein [Sphingobacterium suaedae]|uniref:Oxygenase MpaB family protein n=1 Tax=Sphingobacterium suaedae TaxID=1686402 RepID=A0ABW5KDU4_9SPHI